MAKLIKPSNLHSISKIYLEFGLLFAVNLDAFKIYLQFLSSYWTEHAKVCYIRSTENVFKLFYYVTIESIIQGIIGILNPSHN